MTNRGFTGVSFADTYPLSMDWLWRNRIPMGQPSILAAFGGTGKGLTCSWLISAVSNGWPLPDGGPANPAQGVLWASTEDDSHSVMAPRLLASGANLDNVVDISYVNNQPFSLPDDMPRLAEAAENQGNTGLIVLDPLSVVAMGQIGTVRNVRRFMTPIQTFCNETGIPVLFVHHVNRDGKVNGSRAVMDSVRSVLLLEREENAPNVRTLSIEKTNGGDDTARDLSFTIEGEGEDTHIKWVVQADDNSQVGLDMAAKVVANADGPVNALMVSRETGIPYGTTRVILDRLGSQDVITGVGNGWFKGVKDD